MRWAIRGTGAALAVSVLLAGCGGDDVPAATAPPPTATDGTSGDAGADGTAGGTSAGDASGGATGETEAAQESGPLTVHLAAIGDILSHSRVNVTANRYAGGAPDAYDYTPMFAEVAPLLEAADLTLCHMETPLSPDDTNLSVPDVLVFNTPHEMAEALAAAGVDGCDFASNHTMDHGLQGLADTEQVIRDAGMGYAGPTAHEDEAGVAEVYEVPTEEGPTARVAHLAYTYTYPNSGTPTTSIPDGAPWLVEASWPSIGSEGILEQAEAAREDGADFVVVSMHWGDEYSHQPNADQQRIAEDLLGSDVVDLILGTHVHVIQPCQRINGKHVIYGMGNFLSNQSPDVAPSLLPGTQEGMIAEFTLERDDEGTVTTEMSYHPTRVDIRPWEMETGPHVVQLVSPQNYPETWERTTSVVDSLGGCGATALRP